MLLMLLMTVLVIVMALYLVYRHKRMLWNKKIHQHHKKNYTFKI